MERFRTKKQNIWNKKETNSNKTRQTPYTHTQKNTMYITHTHKRLNVHIGSRRISADSVTNKAQAESKQITRQGVPFQHVGRRCAETTVDRTASRSTGEMHGQWNSVHPSRRRPQSLQLCMGMARAGISAKRRQKTN